MKWGVTKVKHPNKGHTPNKGQKPMYQGVRYWESPLYSSQSLLTQHAVPLSRPVHSPKTSGTIRTSLVMLKYQEVTQRHPRVCLLVYINLYIIILFMCITFVRMCNI